MKDDFSLRPPEECDACQQQISELADAGAALPDDLQAHVAACETCARFAGQWLPGPPAALAGTVVPTAADSHLRERILDAAAPQNVVRFPEAAARRAPWAIWSGRVAAAVALGGFAYWLLNPAATPVENQSKLASTPTVTQEMARLEGRTKREQQLLQTAVVDGGREVDRNVAWSVSALEL